MTIAERLERIGRMKSELDRDRELILSAAAEIKRLTKVNGKLANLALELAQAEDAAAEDVGTGPRTPLVILRELVQAAEAALTNGQHDG